MYFSCRTPKKSKLPLFIEFSIFLSFFHILRICIYALFMYFSCIFHATYMKHICNHFLHICKQSINKDINKKSLETTTQLHITQKTTHRTKTRCPSVDIKKAGFLPPVVFARRVCRHLRMNFLQNQGRNSPHSFLWHLTHFLYS